MTNKSDELDKILEDLKYSAEIDYPGADGMPYIPDEAIAEAKANLIKWSDARVVKELEMILSAAYIKGAFSNPTPALNEFLNKTPLIAGYIVEDRIKALKDKKENV